MDKLNKPLLIFDGNCSFCRLWIERWKTITGDSIDYASSQEIGDRFPEIPKEHFHHSVQYVSTDGTVNSGAKAVFQTLHQVPGKGWWLWAYQHIPGVAPCTEAGYRFVASHRNGLYKITRFLWGYSLEPSTYSLTRWLFLRGLGIMYLIAFLSLSGQLLGLIGSSGILPAGYFLQAVGKQFGSEVYRLFPTLAWLSSSDGFLQLLCTSAIVLSLLAIAGIAPRIVFFLLWIFYLSLFTVGQDFLSFQWDILLLETGFLAIVLAPSRLLPGISKEQPPSRIMIWLMRLLLFKLMFQSGVVKLMAGDPHWLDLTALTYHYETQPIPNAIAWYMHNMPLWFHKISICFMLFVELAAPFLFFAPRRLRHWGAWIQIAFQLLLIATGNYTFFNLLTIVLCIVLFDDRALQKIIRKKFLIVIRDATQQQKIKKPKHYGLFAFASIIIVMNLHSLAGLFVKRENLPAPTRTLLQWTGRFAICNSYGLFRVMTTERPEIVLEGSNDGKTWQAYEFKYKPGDLQRSPPFVAPHQPRLDWQMWFAALSDYQNNPWFVNLIVRLLQGSPEVPGLLEHNPFPEAPPKYIRAVLYDYHFTNYREKASTGNWWKREYKGLYFKPISLRSRQ